MVTGAYFMHGDSVNVGGFFYIVLSRIRGYMSTNIVSIVLSFMNILILLGSIILLSDFNKGCVLIRVRSRTRIMVGSNL